MFPPPKQCDQRVLENVEWFGRRQFAVCSNLVCFDGRAEAVAETAGAEIKRNARQVFVVSQGRRVRRPIRTSAPPGE